MDFFDTKNYQKNPTKLHIPMKNLLKFRGNFLFFFPLTSIADNKN